MRYVHALTMLVVAALLISPLAYVLSSERDDRSRVEETGGDITPVPWDGVTAPWSAPGTQAFATSPSGSGDPGNENNPFLIRSAGELKLLSEMINDNEISAGDKQKYNGTDTYYELTEDILLNDVSSISIWGDGFVPKNIWTPIGWYETSSNSPFEANFNGNDHTVSGVYINNGKDSQGLFGYVTGNVKDLGIDKSFIRGGGTVGGIAGELSGGSITGCSNKGTVTGDTIVGGIAGRAVDSDIMNCYNEGNVRGIGAGAGYAGGTVGLLDHSGLTNCYNAGSVTVTSVDAGGIAGVSSNGSSMTNCFNIGDVKGNVSVGGVVGMISGDSITNCYNAGTVTGNSATGGVFGIGLGSIANCYYLDPAGPSGISFGGNGIINGDTAALTDKLNDWVTSQPAPNDYEQWAGGPFPHLVGVGPGASGTGGNAGDIWDGSIAPGLEGSGTANDPYVISNGAQLAFLADRVNAIDTAYNASSVYYVLANDICLNDTANWTSWDKAAPANTWTPIGNGSSANSHFKANFDGKGFAVKGVYVNNSSNNQGLFGYADGAKISDLGVEQSYLHGAAQTGGVVGDIISSTVIANCYNTGTVATDGASAGGVVGNMEYSSISNCYNTGNINDIGGTAGGVVGNTHSGSVTNCYNTGEVKGKAYVGGVGGYVNYTNISNCYNAGNVTGESVTGGVGGLTSNCSVSNCYNTGNIKSTYIAGGVAGYANNSSILNSYSTGNITGGTNAGGAAGHVDNNGSVANCYNTGSVTGTTAGGVAGYVEKSGSVTNCYNTGSVTGTTAGGLAGYVENSSKINDSYFLKVADGTNSGLDPVGTGGYGYNVFSFSSLGVIDGTMSIGGFYDTSRLFRALNYYVEYVKNDGNTKILYFTDTGRTLGPEIKYALLLDGKPGLNVYGTVTSKGYPLSGVTITYTLDGVKGLTTVTDGNGSYSIEVYSGDDIEITGISRPDYEITSDSPTKVPFVATVNNDITADFRMEGGGTVTVSGTVTEVVSMGVIKDLEGVKVWYLVDSSDIKDAEFETTDKNGYYEISGIPENSAFSIFKIEKVGYAFERSYDAGTFVPIVKNETVDFDMAAKNVTLPINVKHGPWDLPGVSVSYGYAGLTGSAVSGTLTTDDDGNCEIPDVPYGAAVNITGVTKTGYRVSGTSLPGTPVQITAYGGETAYFLMDVTDLTTRTISGKVDHIGNLLTGVMIEYTVIGPAGNTVSTGATTLTDTGGEYSIPNIQFGSTVKITDVSLTGYAVTGTSLPETPVTIYVNDNILQNFSMETTSNIDAHLVVTVVHGTDTLSGVMVAYSMLLPKETFMSVDPIETKEDGTATITVPFGSTIYIDGLSKLYYESVIKTDPIDSRYMNGEDTMTLQMDVDSAGSSKLNSLTVTVTSGDRPILGVEISYTIRAPNGTETSYSNLTDLKGEYKITGIPFGSVVHITGVSKTDYSVITAAGPSEPLARVYVNTDEKINFTMEVTADPSVTHSITGTIKHYIIPPGESNPLDDAYVLYEIYDTNGEFLRDGITDATGTDGVYEIENIPFGSTVYITDVIRDSYAVITDVIYPDPLAEIYVDAEMTQDFLMHLETDTSVTRSLTVTVMHGDQTLPGVSVSYVIYEPVENSEWDSGTVETEGSGSYVMTGIPFGYSVEITGLSKDHYVPSATEDPFVTIYMDKNLPLILYMDIDTSDPLLPSDLSLTVTVMHGAQPLSGVAITYTVYWPDRDSTVSTSMAPGPDDGTYIISGINFGSVVEITGLTKTDYVSAVTDDPIASVYVCKNEGIELQMTADADPEVTFCISGTITHGTMPLDNVKVLFQIQGGREGVVTTIGDGSYAINGIPFGSTVCITGIVLEGYESVIKTAPLDRMYVTGNIPNKNFEMTVTSSAAYPLTFTVMHGEWPLSGVTIEYTITGPDGTVLYLPVIEGPDGTYTISGIPFGSTVEITKISKVYYELVDPLPGPFYMNTEIPPQLVMMSVNDSAYPPEDLTVTGLIEHGTRPLAGAQVEYTVISPDGGSQYSGVTELTGEDGKYTIPDIKFGSTVLINNVVCDGYAPVITDDPIASIYVDQDGTGPDFKMNAMSSVRYSITGTVMHGDRPLSDFVLLYTTMERSIGLVPLSDDGTYSISNILFGSTILITEVSKAGYEVDQVIPMSFYMNTDHEQNFTMSVTSEEEFDVELTVMHGAQPLSGVTIEYTITGPDGTALDLPIDEGPDGTYMISGVPFGSTVLVTEVSKPYYAVITDSEPPEPLASIYVNDDMKEKFMMNVNDLTPGVTYEVSGTVSSEKEGPLSDVIVTYSILGPDGTPLSSDATTSTDTNGVYSIPNIRFGSTVFINVSKDEYVPAIGTYAMGSVYVDGNKTKDFILINVADLPKYTVSGEVKDEKGNPVTDAEVSYVIVGPTGIETAGTVTTDGSGGFSIENITHGSILTITSIDKGGFGPDAGGLLPSVCVESDQTLTPITIYPSASDSADTCWIWLLLAFILLLCATFFLAFGRKREDEEEEEK